MTTLHVGVFAFPPARRSCSYNIFNDKLFLHMHPVVDVLSLLSGFRPQELVGSNFILSCQVSPSVLLYCTLQRLGQRRFTQVVDAPCPTT